MMEEKPAKGKKDSLSKTEEASGIGTQTEEATTTNATVGVATSTQVPPKRRKMPESIRKALEEDKHNLDRYFVIPWSPSLPHSENQGRDQKRGSKEPQPKATLQQEEETQPQTEVPKVTTVKPPQKDKPKTQKGKTVDDKEVPKDKVEDHTQTTGHRPNTPATKRKNTPTLVVKPANDNVNKGADIIEENSTPLPPQQPEKEEQVDEDLQAHKSKKFRPRMPQWVKRSLEDNKKDFDRYFVTHTFPTPINTPAATPTDSIASTVVGTPVVTVPPPKEREPKIKPIRHPHTIEKPSKIVRTTLPNVPREELLESASISDAEIKLASDAETDYKKFRRYGSVNYNPNDNDNTDSESKSSGNLSFSSDRSQTGGKRPDMSWILLNEPPDMNDPIKKQEIIIEDGKLKGKAELFPDIRRLLQLCVILGRLPFNISKTESGSFQSKMKKSIFRLDIYLITGILTLSLIICTMSVFSILLGKTETTEGNGTISSDYGNLEKLMLQKHWLYITVFLLALSVAVAGYWSMIFQGQIINTFFNDSGRILEKLNYPTTSSGIRLLTFLHIAFTVVDSGMTIIMVAGKYLFFWEANRFEMILFMRWMIPQVFLEEVIYSPIVLALEMFVYFASRNFIMLILIGCRPVMNVAHEWNVRTGIRLEIFAPYIAEYGDPSIIKRQLEKDAYSYARLLHEHLLITQIVRRISKTFTPILIVFFSTKILCICCELFRFCTAFLLDLHFRKVGSSKVEGSNIDIKYELTDEEAGVEIGYFLITTLAFLLLASLIMSGVGETVMGGFYPVRRRGLLLSTSQNERKFIMSMYYSFNARRPHVITPTQWFTLDKGIIVSVLGAAMMIFSVMIQFNIVNLVEVSLVIPCGSSAKAEICVVSKNINSADGTNVGEEVIEKSKIPVTLPPIITTMKPGLSCPKSPNPRPKNPSDPCSQSCSGSGTSISFEIKKISRYNSAKEPQNDARDQPSCFIKPYGDVILNNTPVYDCYGVCYDVVDEFNHPPFSLTDKKLELRDIANPKVFEANYPKPAKKCYSEDWANWKNLGKGHQFHPLEICGIPYPYVQDAHNYTSELINGKKPQLPSLVKKKKELFRSDLFNPESINKTAKCLKNIPKYFEEGVEDSQDFVKEEYTNKINIKLGEESFSLTRLVAYSFLYPNEVQGIPIPFNGGSSELPFGYLYLPMSYTIDKSNRNNAKVYSPGYHDCFGNPLDEYDDCGGLPFPIYVTGGGKSRLDRPKKRISIIDCGDIGKCNCWRSQFSAVDYGGYECGFPVNKNVTEKIKNFKKEILKLAEKSCKKWQEEIKRLS